MSRLAKSSAANLLQAALPQLGHLAPTEMFKQLVERGLDALPRPGQGQTLERWRAFAIVAAHDLSLAKLYEGHTDAHEILLTARQSPSPGTTWGTWAAEPPYAKVLLTRKADGTLRLSGRKAWCSGAATVSHGLLTVWECADDDKITGPFLAAVAMDQPGVHVTGDGWAAIGMAQSGSFEIVFEQAIASAVGGLDDYLARRGFWHGGAGIAACWYGGTIAIAESLRSRFRDRGGDAHVRAHLGAVDVLLAQTGALLRETAAFIDAHPAEDAYAVALRVRAAAEQCATSVLEHAGRALGAGAYCIDAAFARRAADLPVFIRQSQAEGDLAKLAESITAQDTSWAL